MALEYRVIALQKTGRIPPGSEMPRASSQFNQPRRRSPQFLMWSQGQETSAQGASDDEFDQKRPGAVQ
jgi:hypothetical protein